MLPMHRRAPPELAIVLAARVRGLKKNMGGIPELGVHSMYCPALPGEEACECCPDPPRLTPLIACMAVAKLGCLPQSECRGVCSGVARVEGSPDSKPAVASAPGCDPIRADISP